VKIAKTCINPFAQSSTFLSNKKIEITDMFRQEDDEKRYHQIVNALHIATCWMPDSPYKKDTLEELQTKICN